MKVVILCDGVGTRLRGKTDFRPTPLAENGGEPIFWHIVKLYSHFGFHEFVPRLGYQGT
jgi:glucose-1-phosphate cytidylyltransferase